LKCKKESNRQMKVKRNFFEKADIQSG